MRIVALPSDDTGCGSYRIIWPAAMVAAAHPDWQVEIYRPTDIKLGHDDKGRLVALGGFDPVGVDVVLMQRVGNPRVLALMHWLQTQGTAVVLDADDALWAIHRSNVAYQSWNSTGNHWQYVDAAARDADLVTVTTRRLAERYGRHGRVEILPNRVPAGVTELRNGREDGPLRFGWPGYVGTHPVDLHAVGNAAARVLATTDAECLIVGDGQGILTAWGLREESGRVQATGALPMDRYFGALTQLDVGLVPLEDSLFNRCKSGLKASELSAAGVPVVATPTPAHTELAKEGFPLLTADSPREWYEQLHRLITIDDLRAETAERALEAARRHSMENHVEQWATAWQRAAQRRSRLQVAG